MKRILLLFSVFALYCLPIYGDVGGGPYVATASSINCTGTTISFDLTITDGGLPFNVTNSGTFTYKDGGTTVGDHLGFISGSVTNKSVNMTSITCSDFIGKTLTIENSDTGVSLPVTNISFAAAPTVAPAAPIPTLGEWGLLIMGVMIILVGLISLKQKSTVTSA